MSFPFEYDHGAPLVFGGAMPHLPSFDDARAVILPGVTIGDHAVIGAGSIVSSDIPPRSVAAGVPARVVRTFECPDDWRRT